jgi:hypothetical protein
VPEPLQSGSGHLTTTSDCEILAFNIGTLEHNMINDNMLSQNIIPSAGSTSGYVFVSTVFAFDHMGWETMVFECKEDGDVVSWSELDSRRHRDIAEATFYHAEFMREWRGKIADGAQAPSVWVRLYERGW